MVVWVHEVVYDDPSTDSVTSVACTHVRLPVTPAPDAHSTTHSTVLVSVTFESDSTLPTVSPGSSVPPKGVVTLATTGEIVDAMLPSVFSSSSTADPWKPDGHAFAVVHVGEIEVGPLVGLSTRAPSWLPNAGTAA